MVELLVEVVVVVELLVDVVATVELVETTSVEMTCGIEVKTEGASGAVAPGDALRWLDERPIANATPLTSAINSTMANPIAAAFHGLFEVMLVV